MITAVCTELPNTQTGVRWTWRMRLAVALASLIYAGLAVWLHYDRAWQGDEWGSYLAFDQGYGTLSSSFGEWQTMNFYLMVLKAIHQVGGTNWALVLPGVLCGMWLVWLAASLALQLGGDGRSVATAAFFTAVNPWLITYGVTIRSYIFLAAFSAAMVLCFLRWRDSGRWRDAILCGLSCALALLAHLNAVYTFAAVGTVFICWMIRAIVRHESGWLARALRLAVPCFVLIGLAAAAYAKQIPDILRFQAMWSDTPPIPLTFLPATFVQFFGSGYLVIPAILALLYASWRTTRERRQSQWLLLMSVVAVASISLAGVSHYPNTYARFLIGTLPLLLVVTADGLWAAAKGQVLHWACVCLLIGCSLAATSATRASQHRYPWHRIARTMQSHVREGDRCALLGPPVNATALQVYGVQAGTDIAAVLQACESGRSVQLILLDITSDRQSRLPSTEIGQSRVIVLSGAPSQIASQLITDLTGSVNGRVSSDLAQVYQQISSLLRWTGNAADAGRYDLLRERCQALDPRSRNRPPQFLRGQLQP